MKLLFFILACCLLPVAFSVEAATYYVTKGGGGSTCSLASPCLTIQAGVNKTTGAGDIVDVAVGTYTETVSTWPVSGAAGNPIIIQAHAGDVVTWTGPNNAASGTGAIYIQDKNYIRITGFNFANTSSFRVIELLHSAALNKAAPMVGIEIINNTFNSNGSNGTTAPEMSRQIHAEYLGMAAGYGGATVNTISGNTFTNNWGSNIDMYASSDVLIANNTSTGQKGSLNPSNGNLYQANLVQGFSSAPYVDQRNIVQNNVISGMFQVAGQATEDVGVRMDVGAQKWTVQGNTFHDLGSEGPAWNGGRHFYGIYCEANCNNNTFVQNVIYNINEGCIGIGNSGVSASATAAVYNNTLNNCGQVGLYLDNVSSVTVRNNIVSGNTLASVIVTPSTVKAGGHTFSNNDWYKVGTTLFGLWNFDPNTSGWQAGNLNLANWVAASKDSNSISADPLFVGAPDFHLQSKSPAIDHGFDVGLAFAGSNPDMGAFESGGGVVTLTNDRFPGITYTAHNTATWTTAPEGTPLKAGINNITVTATDSGGNAGTATRQIIFQPGFPGNTLAAAYGFNEANSGTTPTSTADASTNGNTGSLINGVTWAGNQTISLNALSNQFVSVSGSANNSLNFTQSFTLSASVMPTAVYTDFRAIMEKPGTGQPVFQFFASSDAATCGGAGVPSIWFNANGILGPNYHLCSLGPPLTINVFTHLAATYDGTTLRLYRNGVLDNSMAATGFIEPSTYQLYIGSSENFEPFGGQMKQVRLYNWAIPLTAGSNTSPGAACVFGNPLDPLQQSVVRDMNCPVASPAPPLPIKFPASATGLKVGSAANGLKFGSR